MIVRYHDKKSLIVILYLCRPDQAGPRLPVESRLMMNLVDGVLVTRLGHVAIMECGHCHSQLSIATVCQCLPLLFGRRGRSVEDQDCNFTMFYQWHAAVYTVDEFLQTDQNTSCWHSCYCKQPWLEIIIIITPWYIIRLEL